MNLYGRITPEPCTAWGCERRQALRIRFPGVRLNIDLCWECAYALLEEKC